jgi:hypothetical protein
VCQTSRLVLGKCNQLKAIANQRFKQRSRAILTPDELCRIGTIWILKCAQYKSLGQLLVFVHEFRVGKMASSTNHGMAWLAGVISSNLTMIPWVCKKLTKSFSKSAVGDTVGSGTVGAAAKNGDRVWKEDDRQGKEDRLLEREMM